MKPMCLGCYREFRDMEIGEPCPACGRDWLHNGEPDGWAGRVLSAGWFVVVAFVLLFALTASGCGGEVAESDPLCGPHCVCEDGRCQCEHGGQCIESMQRDMGIFIRKGERLEAENARLQEKFDWLNDAAMRMRGDHQYTLVELSIEKTGRPPAWLLKDGAAIAERPCNCICAYYKPFGCDCGEFCRCPEKPE